MLLQHRRPINTQEYSVTQAADICGCHPDTIRRWAKAGKIPGAHQDGEDGFGDWHIPTEGLVECGLLASVATASTEERSLDDPAEAEREAHELTVRHLEETVERLEAQIKFYQSTISQLLNAAGNPNDKRSH